MINLYKVMERKQRNIELLGKWYGGVFNQEKAGSEVVRVSETFRGKWVVVYTIPGEEGYAAALIDNFDCWFGVGGVYRHWVRGCSIAEAVRNICIGCCEKNYKKFLNWRSQEAQKEAELF